MLASLSSLEIAVWVIAVAVVLIALIKLVRG